MKTTISMKVSLVACGVVLAGTALAFNKTMYPYTLPSGKLGAAMGCIEAKEGMTLEPGKWYTNFQVCKDFADKNGIPLVALWSNESCIHCWYTDVCFIQDDFVQWKNANAAGKVIYCFMAGGYGGYDQSGSAAYNWMWYGGGTKLNAYPFVVLWWQKEGVNERYTGDNFCDTIRLTEASIPGRVTTIIGRLENAFAKWSPTPDYAGGSFADPDTEGNRLEFEEGTESVTVKLERPAASAAIATNVTLAVVGPTGTTISSQVVTWSADQTNAVATIGLPKGACTVDGQQISLYLQDGGVNHATNHITYVKRAASASNPLWIGESFGFGEWTCDLDAATNKVGKAAGEAYTIVSIQGSKWCPDCANTDRNFLEVTNQVGVNRFCAWAKSKNIALVSMDIPNYTGPTVADRKTPTLFSKDAYATTLARAKEYPGAGAPAELTNAVVRSGLGYLTRKEATDAQAAEVLAKFHDLAISDTDRGGFHRPEDLNKNRTGVPIFVLLRKDGSVAARFTRFATESPKASDKDNFDNYIQRFEEMLAIAASSGDYADAFEIENNYPGNGAVAFAANGGAASGTLCNADFQDAFKLVGVGGNADQKVLVKGAADSTAEVSVQFWKKDASGSFVTEGDLVYGALSNGVALTRTFVESGDYYLLVKGKDITSAGFDAASRVANHFHKYTVTGSTVLVPQGDQVKANAPAGSDKVTIRLISDAVYCFAGVDTNANPTLVQVGDMGAYKFLKATVSGDTEVTISTGPGGEISYQIWQPGQVGFVETARSVPESINDLNDDWVEFLVARTDGKSGRVKARVTIDLAKTTMLPARYVFATNALNAVDFIWEDGVTSNMTVKVKIDDDLLYDGDRDIVFNLEVISSDNGDVKVADGKGVYTLTVEEDDKSEPGRALITRVTPDYAKKNTVYARESDGAKLYAQRIEACDGLVAAELTSTVDGTTYEVLNPRDLTNKLGRTYLYWSSREWDEKYVLVKGIPAGKSAKIQLKSFMGFETVAGSNTVTIVSVADDAPVFAESAASFGLYRYVAISEGSVAVALDPASLGGGTVTFTKLSGTLPAGLKAVYDATKKAMIFSGVPTAKPGTYEVAYQVIETRSGTKVPGLTTKVTFVVTDPTDIKTSPEVANPAVATVRTFKDIAIVNPVSRRLAGVLQLTVPPRGNLSGKYFCERGTISLSGNSWRDFNPTTRGLSAGLAGRSTDIIIGVTANADGSLDVAVQDPEYPDVQLDGTIDGKLWTKTNTAADWQGYYTVALPVEAVLTNATDNLAPTGAGYLTLDLTRKSAWNTGTVKWAGMLPNGTAVSGSTVLGSPYSGTAVDGTEKQCDWANLPIFKCSSKDTLSVGARIMRNAIGEYECNHRAVVSTENIISGWEHFETRAESAHYLANLGVYGAIYDKDDDLCACCSEFYETTNMVLKLDVSGLVWTGYGEPEKIDPLSVMVSSDAITIKDKENPSGVSLKLNRSTGVVTGTFDLFCGDYSVPASYKAVVLAGWGAGCGCGPSAGLKTLPFVNGSFFYTDKVNNDSGKAIKVSRGGAAVVDAE